MSQEACGETIELLSVDLLDEQRPYVESLKRLAASLRLEFGWHYLLDLAWILGRLGAVEGKKLMDAGAGTGVLQWYLAEQGARVISVDRMSRAALPLRFRRRFHVQGLRPSDLSPAWSAYIQGFRRPARGAWLRRWAARGYFQALELVDWVLKPPARGSVIIYNQDLANLAQVADNSLDAVVSVSALEHNTPQGLQAVVRELMRVLKPGGVLLATLTAGRDQDWWHEASSGWCYTDATLRQIFDLPANVSSNYGRYDELFEKLRNCAELRDNLASFYFHDDHKGMPGGVWNPQYQPVGVCKIKSV